VKHLTVEREFWVKMSWLLSWHIPVTRVFSDAFSYVSAPLVNTGRMFSSEVAHKETPKRLASAFPLTFCSIPFYSLPQILPRKLKNETDRSKEGGKERGIKVNKREVWGR
jgi:hypothetical protein